MVITRANILKFWLSEPSVEPCPAGYAYLDFSRPSFPDMKTLSFEERDAFRPVLERHSEYLLEIWCDRKRIQ